MDVVYLCRAGENEELRYSLRSLVNLPHDRVWVFGGRPSWLSRVEYVAIGQAGDKNGNARRNLEAACRHPEVSDPFILMNDDFFIVQPLDSLPVLHRGTVAEVIAEHEARGLGRSTYTEAMRQTLKRLQLMGHTEPLSYSLHIPMAVTKAAMLAAIAAGDGIDRAQYRTLYGNIDGVGGVKVADVKLRNRREPLPPGPFLSTSDRTFSRALPRLRELFPEPGEHEYSIFRDPPPAGFVRLHALKRFKDRVEGVARSTGDHFDVPEPRALELINLRFVEQVAITDRSKS